MPTNRAAWQDKPGIKLLIRPAPYPNDLTPNQILLQLHAWAINPADHFIQDCDAISFIKYPLILGEDAAGTIVSVGTASATRFKPNDRILAVTTGSALGRPEMGGFQEYVIVDSRLACHIPDFISFAEASVFKRLFGSAESKGRVRQHWEVDPDLGRQLSGGKQRHPACKGSWF